jgi:hypothetical protein
MNRCLAACETALCYVRSGQQICGVIGLLAIDRSQQHLRLCIDVWRGVRDLNSPGATIHSIAGLCYANANNRYFQGDTHIQEMWLYAAYCADTLNKLQPDQVQHTSNPESRRVVPLSLKERTQLIAEAVDLDAQQTKAFESGKAWSARFLGRAAYLCRLAVVGARICDLLQSSQRSLPAGTWITNFVLKHQCLAVNPALTLIEENKIVYDVADRLHSTEVKQLSERAVRRLWEAVDVLTAKPSDVPDPVHGFNDHEHDRHLLDEKQCIAEALAHNAVCLARLVSDLSPVMAQLDAMRVENPSLEAANLAREFAECALQELTESAEVGSSVAVHVRELQRLESDIVAAAEWTRSARCNTANYKVQDLLRYTAEAAKVCRDKGPAHSALADCWLQAATHVKLAIQGCAELHTESDTQRVYNHTVCFRLCEKLATGTFSDAAQFNTRATRTACQPARQLWQEASELLLQSGTTHMRRAGERAAEVEVYYVELDFQSGKEIAQARCAYACAACADAVELAPEAAGAVVTLLDSSSQLSSLFTPFRETEVDYSSVAVRMHLLLVLVERTILARTISSDFEVAYIDRVEATLRYVLEDIRLLATTCQLAVRSYPADHPLHVPAAPLGALLSRDEALRWLCDAASECCQEYLDMIATQIRRPSPTGDWNRAEVDIINAFDVLRCVHSYAINGEQCVRIRTNEELQRYQVLCKLCLAASRLALSHELLPHDLLDEAINMGIRSTDGSPVAPGLAVKLALGNALVHRAWQELSAPFEPLSTELLLPVPNDGTVTVDARAVGEKVAAHVQRAIHVLILEGNTNLPPREIALRNRAIAYYKAAADDNLWCAYSSTHAPSSSADLLYSRVMQAASWCNLAVQALHKGREDVAALYEQAMQFVVVTVVTGAPSRDFDEQAANEKGQRVCHSAGVRFAAAAQALAAGDLPLYQLWLRAAEATAELVVVTQSEQEGHGWQDLAATTTDAAIKAADWLAAQTLHSQVESVGPSQSCAFNVSETCVLS